MKPARPGFRLRLAPRRKGFSGRIGDAETVPCDGRVAGCGSGVRAGTGGAGANRARTDRAHRRARATSSARSSRDLDKALAFYRDGLGLDVQGAPANADANAALRNMFGLPDAQLRWSIGRPAGMRTGVEIVEISKAGGRAVERRLQDSGAFMLIVLVRDLDAIFGRLTQLGAPVVTKGGKPIAVPSGSRARAVIVKDPDGHFVELYQPDPLPAATATPAPNVIEVRVRLAVNDVEQATRLYVNQLGMAMRSPGNVRRQPGGARHDGAAIRRPVPRVDVHGADHGTDLRADRLQGRRSAHGEGQPPGPRLHAHPAAGARRGRGRGRGQSRRAARCSRPAAPPWNCRRAAAPSRPPSSAIPTTCSWCSCRRRRRARSAAED